MYLLAHSTFVCNTIVQYTLRDVFPNDSFHIFQGLWLQRNIKTTPLELVDLSVIQNPIVILITDLNKYRGLNFNWRNIWKSFKFRSIHHSSCMLINLNLGM